MAQPALQATRVSWSLLCKTLFVQCRPPASATKDAATTKLPVTTWVPTANTCGRGSAPWCLCPRRLRPVFLLGVVLGTAAATAALLLACSPSHAAVATLPKLAAGPAKSYQISPQPDRQSLWSPERLAGAAQQLRAPTPNVGDIERQLNLLEVADDLVGGAHAVLPKVKHDGPKRGTSHKPHVNSPALKGTNAMNGASNSIMRCGINWNDAYQKCGTSQMASIASVRPESLVFAGLTSGPCSSSGASVTTTPTDTSTGASDSSGAGAAAAGEPSGGSAATSAAVAETTASSESTSSSSTSTSYSSSNSFAGINSYYLHTLSDSDQDTMLQAIASAGYRVIRIFIVHVADGNKGTSATGVNDIEELSIGGYDDTVLGMIDDFMLKCYDNGLKLIIALHDRYSLGTWDTDEYGSTYGDTNFYTDSTAQSQFDARINHILTQHKSQRFGHIDFVNPSWHCDRAATIRGLLPADTSILISTGGGTDFYSSLYSQFFDCADIDIVAVHSYGNDASSQLSGAVSSATAAGKRIMYEEFGNTGDGKSSGNAGEASAANQLGVPWLAWEASFPGKPDDYEFWTDEDTWSSLAGYAASALTASSPFSWPWTSESSSGGLPSDTSSSGGSSSGSSASTSSETSGVGSSNDVVDSSTSYGAQGLTACQYNMLFQITSVFETGSTTLDYGVCGDIGDGNGFSAGCIQFPTSSGSALAVVQDYLNTNPSSNLAGYVSGLQSVQGSGDTSAISGFCDAWSAAASSDPSGFGASQMKIAAQNYLAPNSDLVSQLGLKTATGAGQIMDCAIQLGIGGCQSIAPRRRRRQPPIGGAYPGTVYRVNAYQHIVSSGNLDFSGDTVESLDN
ncbi:hypothetical protein HK405_010119, partial [Cladochytrium tenue]